jgi:hemerythrin HHE cation binding domain-containing protein
MLVEIINQQHLELRELFARHQEMLLQGNFEAAGVWLEQYDVCQKAHMKIEENYLFPEFEKIERSTKWDVSLYQKEHDKIKQLYSNVVDDLNWLSEQQLNETDQRRNIIALLDKEKTLKGLNEHHEEREEEALLKELDEKLEQRTLKELKLDIKLTWAEVIASIKETAQDI